MIGLVDGNNFFVSCERVFNRRLVGRPVAVLSNNDGCSARRVRFPTGREPPQGAVTPRGWARGRGT